MDAQEREWEFRHVVDRIREDLRHQAVVLTHHSIALVIQLYEQRMAKARRAA